MTWLQSLRRRSRDEHELAVLLRETLEQSAAGGLRLIPIVSRELCHPVAALLAAGQLEEAARLVPADAWLPIAPNYG